MVDADRVLDAVLGAIEEVINSYEETFPQNIKTLREISLDAS